MKNKNEKKDNIILDYWKDYITMHNVLACELSYSLIYNNIRPERMKEALATVHLTDLPNRFFLIQVDDYYNYSSNMQITQEFYQKLELIRILQSCMENMGLEGFVANLVGIDKMVCFLCFEEKEPAEVRKYLSEIAEYFKTEVRKRSVYTISVCISRRCGRLWQYSQMKPLMEQALNKSYFSGKEFSIFLEEAERRKPERETSLNSFYPELMAVFSRGDRERMEVLLQSMARILLEGREKPSHAKIELIRLIQRMSDYGIRCGILKKQMKELSDRTTAQMMACGFIADAKKYFMGFFDSFQILLKEKKAGEEYLFQIPVGEYIETHYMENIRLKDLAELVGFSEGHFTRIFREEFGVTFVQYLTNCRIVHSKELLLDTSVPIEQIAYQVGINSYSYFCTCFKRLCGVSPGEFRKNNREKYQNFEIESCN